MSECSESYHLEADDQQAGIHLLQRANLDGVAFPPQGGWVSILPRSKFGQLSDALVQANQGVLLRYLLDEDAGWMFQVFTGPQLASHYQCRWLDWSDQEGRIKVDTDDPDVAVVQALAKRHRHGVRLGRQLERVLHLAPSGAPMRRRARSFMALPIGTGARWWRTRSPSLWPFPTMSGSGGGTTHAMREGGPSKEQSGSGTDGAGSPSPERIHTRPQSRLPY